jgi:hypothetical protein
MFRRSHLSCAVQEIDNLCFEDKSAETDDEEKGGATCKPILKYSEIMQCLVTYHHFLSGFPDMPESVIRTL